MYGVLILVIITLLGALMSYVFVVIGFYSSLYDQTNIGDISLGLIALIVTFVFARIIEVKSKSEAIKKSIIWTTVIILYMVILSILNNDNFSQFKSNGLYIMFIGLFLGPILYKIIKHLK